MPLKICAAKLAKITKNIETFAHYPTFTAKYILTGWGKGEESPSGKLNNRTGSGK
jgi:hypothetical protein